MRLARFVDRVATVLGAGPRLDFNLFLMAVQLDARPAGVKLTAKRKKLLRTWLGFRDENAQPVIRKVHKPGVEADPLRGRFKTRRQHPPRSGRIRTGSPNCAIPSRFRCIGDRGASKPSCSVRCCPTPPTAWYQSESKVKIGYEISFTRYFYKPKPMRTLEEIRADILALEQETEGLLGEILEE